MRSRLRSPRGYSIFELVVVVIVIGVITAVAMKSMRPSVDTTRLEKTKARMDQIAFAIAGNPERVSGGARTDFGYVGDVGSLPPNLDALAANPGSYATWKGPYIRDDFSGGGSSSRFKNDAWGKAFAFSGGASISSTGGGSTLTRTIANTVADITNNLVVAVVTDIDASPPGPNNTDSVRFVFTFPNGSGGTTTDIRTPGPDGTASFSAVPIGVHQIKMVYVPTNDTLIRKVAVNPGQASYIEIQYPDNLWWDTAATGGGPGGSGVLTIRPNGVGSENELDDQGCGPNWECVDDVASDEDGTYVLGINDTYFTDTYDAENHTSETGTVDSVVVYMRSRGPNSGRRARTSIITHGNQYDGSIVDLSSVGSYTDYHTSYVNNPNTSATWTWSEIDNLEIGVTIRRTARCTQVWAEVYYTY